MKVDVVQRKAGKPERGALQKDTKYFKADKRCFNCRKKGHFTREYWNPPKEYEKKRDDHKRMVKQMVQVITKEKILTKEESKELFEIHNILKIHEKPEQEGGLTRGFFDELIGQAKLV